MLSCLPPSNHQPIIPSMCLFLSPVPSPRSLASLHSLITHITCTFTSLNFASVYFEFTTFLLSPNYLPSPPLLSPPLSSPPLPSRHSPPVFHSCMCSHVHRLMQLISLVPTDPSVLQRMGVMFEKDQRDMSQAFQYHYEVCTSCLFYTGTSCVFYPS